MQDTAANQLENNVTFITYLVKMGKNHIFLLSPKTSWKLLYFPKLNPSLSAPVRNIGALKASEKK